MANKIEIPVSLGLQDAMQQAAELRKLLTTDIKPNTHSYQMILSILNKIDLAASGLKGKLSTAFQTSKGSASFLREYEKLLNLLESVKSQFSDVGLSEIKLSVDDTKKVEDYTRKIHQLQEQIQAVQGGKIGGFFNIDEFKQAKNLLDQLKIDPSKLTFQGLADKLDAELKKAKDGTADLEAQFKNVENVIKNLGKGNLSNLNNELKKATENADGLTRKVTDAQTKRDINTKLITMFDGLDGVNLKARTIDEDTNIDKFIQEETKRIVKAYDDRISEVTALTPRVTSAITALTTTPTSALKNLIKSDQIKDAFSSLGIENLYNNFIKSLEKGTGNEQDIADKMRDRLQSLLNIGDLSNARDEAISKIQGFFSVVSEVTVEKAAPFKKALQDIFAKNNIEIKGTGIEDLISKIKEGESVTTILDNITKALQNYVATAGQNPANNASLVQLKDDASRAQTAIDEVNKAFSSVSGNLGDKQNQINNFIEAIRTLQEIAKGGINLPPSNGDADKAKNSLDQYLASLNKLEGKQKALSNVQSAVTRWMGFYQVLNLTKRAIKSMTSHITELDSVMTKIAVVTNMTTGDLWNQIGKYSEIARQYGVAIKGVYEVSQIYYQQGLNKGDVMGLTTETLKMARIAGIDYATAADYMTTAIRGFKLEMSDAAHVTDVFSNLAAHTASSTEELATAISKTAASAASVGASFEATSAMMATMIATTRESATNIGTALKSIISRYGEMKANPEGKDSEGEDYSLNKVDTALQSIGIHMQDANHQFRDFDDVILELGEKWDTIDKSAQRYIATIMAGNRQQSRFLALVSNVEEYKRALDLAQNSENAGELQTLKTLDSVDAKLERMKVTVQEFYTNSGIEQLYKGILDTITNVISAANDMPKIFGSFPGIALSIGMQIINIIKTVATLGIASVSSAINQVKTGSIFSIFDGLSDKAREEGTKAGEAAADAITGAMSGRSSNVAISAGKKIGMYVSAALSAAAASLSIASMNKYGSSISPDEDRTAGGLMLGSSLLSASGSALSAAIYTPGGLVGKTIAASIAGLTSLVPSLISAINMLHVDYAREIELAKKDETKKTEEATKAKGTVSELEDAYEKLSELEKKQYESAEALQEYHDQMNQLADLYPYLVDSMTIAGDKIIQTTALENELANARGHAAEKTLTALRAEQKTNDLMTNAYKRFQAQMNLTYTGDLKNFNIAQYVSDLRSGLNGAERFQTEGTITSIRDPYEFLVKAYDRAVPLNEDPTKNNGFVRLKQLIINKNGYGRNNWQDIFEQNAEMILKWADMQHEENGMPTIQSSMRKNLKNSLDNLQKEAEAAGLSVNFSEITELDNLTNTEDLLNADLFSYEQIISAITRAKKYIQDELTWADETSKTLNKTAFDVEIERGVRSKSAEDGMENLINYLSIITSLRDFAGFKLEEGFDSTTNQQIFNDLSDWLIKNSSAAEKLLKLNLDNMSIGDKAAFAAALNIDVDDENNTLILDALVAKYTKDTETVRKNFNEALEKSIFKTGENIYDEKWVNTFKSLTDADSEQDIPPALIKTLQSQLVQYRELKDKGYGIAANNYLTGIKSLYTELGYITNEEDIESLTKIMSSLDLTDIEAIDTTIDSLKDQESMKGIVEVLTNIKKLISTDVGLAIEQMLSSSLENIKSLEKTVGNVGKGMEYSTALEAAQEILNQAGDKKTLAQDLVFQDIDTGKWMLTRKALYTSYNSIVKKAQDDITEISQQLSLITDNTKAAIKAINPEQFKGEENGQSKLAQFKGITEESILKGGTYKDLGFKTEEEFSNAVVKFNERLTYWVEEFNKGNTGYNSWTEYVNARYDELDIAEKKLIASAENMQNAIKTAISSTDFSGIAGGTVSESTKTNFQTLLHMFNAELDSQFNDIWKELVEGKFDQFEQLTGLIVSKETKKSAKAAEVQQHLTAIEDLNKPLDAWADSTRELIDKYYSTPEKIASSQSNRDMAISQLYTRLRGLIDGTNYTLEDYNNDITALTQRVNKVGLEKDTYDLLSGGFTGDEFTEYVNKWIKEDIGLFMDKDGQFIGQLEGLFKFDPKDGYQIADGHTAEEVSQVFAQIAGFATENFSPFLESLLGDEVDRAIRDLETQDVDKKAASALSSLASAKRGDYTKISDLPKAIQEKLDGNADGIYHTVSEFERDTLLLALKESDFAGDVQSQAVLRDLQANIRQKRSQKGSAISGVISKTVSVDAAKAITRQQYGEDMEYYYKQAMQNMGFYWDEFNEVFMAQDAAYNSMQALIDSIPDIDEKGHSNKEFKAGLQATLNELKKAEANKPINTLRELLNNSVNVSEQMIQDFNRVFGVDLTPYLTENKATGEQELDFEKLKSEQAEILENTIGENWEEQVVSYINQLADSYMENAQKAGQLVTQGTTSTVEMQAFTEAYNNKMFPSDSPKEMMDLFGYNEILKAWTLDPSVLRSVVQQQAEKIKGQFKTDEELANWVDSQTNKMLAEQVNLSDFLNAEDKATSGEAYKKLYASMQAYYKAMIPDATIGQIDEIITSEIDNLSKGGETAVAVAKAWAARQGKTLTAEEMQQYYAPLVKKYSDMAEQIPELVVGQYVGEGEFRTLLEKHGIVNSATGLVNQVENMAEAYKAIYDEMGNVAGVTTSDLNSIYAKYLTESESQEMDAISVLEDAMSMTYESLGELLGKYGQSLEKWLAQNKDLYELVGGGKLRITNFNALAQQMGWDFGSEEYVSAFKTYNDALIDLNKKTEKTILEEVLAVENAQAGDLLNLTQFSVTYQKALAKSTNLNDYLKQAEEVLRVHGGDRSASSIASEMAQSAKEFNNTIIDTLNEQLVKAGAVLSDGILTLLDDADPFGILSVLSNAIDEIERSGKDIDFGEAGAKIKDSLNSITKSYFDDISSGMSGTLSNEQAVRLRQYAMSQANKTLSFNETAEGLQLTEDSFFSLYSILKKTNKMMAKKLLPDMSKMSNNYRNLGDAMEAYAEALKLDEFEKASALRDLLDSMFADPNTYKLMDQEMPPTWQSADNFYQSAKKAFDVVQQMKKGTVGVQDFTAFAESLINSGDAEAKQKGLELLQRGSEFIKLDAKGNTIVDMKELAQALDVKNLAKWADDYYTVWKNAAEKIQEAGVNQQKAYNTLFYGSENLEAADIYDEKGNIVTKKLKDYLEKEETGSKAISDLLEKIKIGNTNLKDKVLNGENLEANEASLLKAFSKVNWENGHIDEQLETALSGLGFGGTVSIDDKGELTIEINTDPDNWNIVHTVDGIPMTGDAAADYMKAKAEEEFSTKTFTDEKGEITGYKSTFKIGETEVTLQYDVKTGKQTYTCTTPDKKTIIADTYDDCLTALAAFGNQDAQDKAEGITRESRHIKVDNVEFILEIVNGKTTVKFAHDYDKSQANEEMRTTLQDEFNKSDTSVDLTKPVTATTDDVTVKLAEGAVAKMDLGSTDVHVPTVHGTTDNLVLSAQHVEVNQLEEPAGVNDTEIDVKANTDDATKQITKVGRKLKDINDTKSEANVKPSNSVATVQSALEKILSLLQGIQLNKNIEITTTYKTFGTAPKIPTTPAINVAKGNVALARGSTLMGELGPEMYVSNGHYYVVGQHGPEMVSLADDAIVFNHIQTRQLLKHGRTPQNGRAVTNDYKAAGEAHASSTNSFSTAISNLINGAVSGAASLINNTISYVKEATQQVKETATQGKANIEQAERLDKIAQHAGSDKLKQAAQNQADKLRNSDEAQVYDKLVELQELAEKNAKAQKSAADSMNKAAGGMGGAASAQQSAAAATSRAAIDISNMRNAWASQQDPRGGLSSPENLVHPGAAPKLADVFEGWTASSSNTKTSSTYGSVYVQSAAAGTGSTLNRSIDSALASYYRAKGGNGAGGGGADEDAAKVLKEAKSAVSTFLNDLLTLGIESIDLSKYDKIPDDIKSGIQERIDRNDSYRSFVNAYASTLEKSMSEINETYFQAWQKDLEAVGLAESQMEAIENLSFFNNGEIAGGADDWVTILGDKAYIGDAVEEGVFEWNAALRQYIVKDQSALEEFMNTRIGNIWNFPDVAIDQAQSIIDEINDYLEKAIKDEGLSAKDRTRLQELLKKQGYNNPLDFVQTSKNKFLLKSSSINDVTNAMSSGTLTGEDQEIASITAELKDALQELFNSVADQVNKALDEGLTNVEIEEFKDHLKQLDVDLDLTFEKSLTGLKLSTTSAIELYNVLQKIDATQAQLVFRKLNESLKESNDHYKTTTKILARIRELQDAINDAEHYSDEKIKQYKQELALAKEILAVRATSEDDSFDIANREIPGGLKNALTYAESISSIAREFRSAFEDPDNDIIDFQHFYNMAYEINDAAAFLGKSIDFLGYTLDGKIDNLDKLITQAANSLGASADGSNFGVSLSKLGTDLKNGMNGFVGGADEAMHAMAQAQIEILDGLIAMFEVIVAMEEFEGADINKNGLLDLDEIFDLTGLAKDAIDTAKVFKKQFKEAATAILETLNSNDAYKDIADSIKLNGYTFRQILEDATDGIRDIVEISAEEYQQMVSVLYEAFSNGDYDLNDIYNSLKENFINNDSNWDGNLEINDLVFNVKYKAELTKTAEGYETPGGTVYPDAKTAVQGLAIESVGGTNITFDPVTMTSTGSITLGKSAISLNVATDNSGEVTYYSSSGAYYTLDDAIRGEWEAARAGGSTTLDLEEWKIDQKIKVVPVVEADLKETDLDLDQQQINAAIGKSYEDIRAEWQAAVANGTELEFEAKYGVSFTNSTTEEDWLRFKELAGIETKNIELNASINIVNSSNEVSQLLTFDSSDKSVTVNVAANTDNATQAVEALKNNVDSTTGIVSVDANVDSAVSKLQKVIDAINDIDTDININVNVTQTGEVPSTSDSSSEAASAKGTVSGEAFAGGTRTLMGELGPELYVSGGRYHLAGQNGAEFVNLPDDAIVFNHLQTQRLLSTGSAGRGKPVTNEANAVAMARGTGPAAATARETLATLKQIRAMWQSLANMSVSELAGSTKATDSGNKENIATWIQKIEKWFTLLQKIATLEKEINREEKLRSALQSKTVAMGDKYAQSLVRTLKASKEQLALEQELANSYLQEYNKKRTEINGDSPFNYFFTFDEKGQIIYDESHYQDLVNLLNTQYETNELAESQPQRQVALAKQYGLSRYMEYDSSGKKITREENESDSEFAVRQLDALKYSMDTIKEEIQGDYDAWFEHTNTALDLESSINSTVQEIRNNQKDLEDKVVAAIEAREQAVIDKMTDEREKLSKASQSYIQGLQDALSKERKMYENNQNDKELASLNRKLSILQRSGGSQSEITALQKEIQEKNKDMYFTAQEDQIAAIQDASDLQLEKMQTQIDLMTETLEYSKEHGLLWAEVNEVLKGTSEQIATFITSNMSEWQSKSTLAQEEELKEILFIAQEFTELKEYNSDQISGAANTVSEKIDEVLKATNITIEKKNTAPIITTPTTTTTTNNKQSNSKIPPYLDGYYRDDAFYWDEYSRQWIYNEGAQKTKQTPYSKSSSYGSSYEKNLQALQTQVNNQKNYIKQLQQKGASEQELQQARSKLSSLTTNLALHKFKHGGMVTETGLVQVHGTEARPEAFMNANEVQMWKQDILGGGAHSLLGEMLELRSLYDSMSNISDTVTQNTDSIVIEHAEVNMNIDQLADDYDARRAGTTALDEMLKIARKSGANSIRR